MCELCSKLGDDHRAKVDKIYSLIEERLANSKASQIEGSVAFSTLNFPKLYGVWFEPRMQLQMPFNFYQSIIVDGQKLRNDWASGWLRVVSFEKDSLFILAQGTQKKEDKEYIVFLHQLEFRKGEYKVDVSEGGRITISAENIVKEGIDLFTEKPTSHKYSFTFIHTPTERSFMPKDRIESSGLYKSVYHGKTVPKPLTFDWSSYVITVPHFAFHSILHQKHKEFGFASAIEMQHSATNCLKSHLGI